MDDFSMYLCPSCKKVFKVKGSNKKVKCTQCSELLLDMHISLEAWGTLDKNGRYQLKEKTCNPEVDTSEEELIVEEIDLTINIPPKIEEEKNNYSQPEFVNNEKPRQWHNIIEKIRKFKPNTGIVCIIIVALLLGGVAFYKWYNSADQIIKRSRKARAAIKNTEYVEKDYDESRSTINTDVDNFTDKEREDAKTKMRMAARDYCEVLKDKQSNISDVRMDFDDNIALYFNKVCLKVYYDDLSMRWGYLYFKQSGDDWVITEFRYED